MSKPDVIWEIGLPAQGVPEKQATWRQGKPASEAAGQDPGCQAEQEANSKRGLWCMESPWTRGVGAITGLDSAPDAPVSVLSNSIYLIP